MAKARLKQKNYRVFISHATADKWVATQLDRMIQEALEREDATFRDDRDIESGNKIPEEIRKQLHACQELLVLWTPQAIESKWVLPETAMAYGIGLHVVAIRYLADIKTLPPFISTELSLELTHREVKKYCEDLKARARRFQRSDT